MEQEKNTITRREFAKRATAGATAIAGFNIANRAYAANNDPLKIGLIGCGGRGKGAVMNALMASQNVSLVAVGDVIEHRAKEAIPYLKQRLQSKEETKDLVKNIQVDEEHIVAQAVRFGEGIVFATPLALWEENAVLSAVLTNVLLEAVFTAGREHIVFEHPLPEETEVVCGRKDGKLVVCVVNETDKELPVSMLLPESLRKGAVVSILSSDGSVRKVALDGRQAEAGVRFRVPPHWFALMLLEERK